MQVLSTGAGKDKFLCACSQEIWLFAAINNCTIDIPQKPGKGLILADALSRCHDDCSYNEKANAILNCLNLQHIHVQHSFDILNVNL